MVGGLSSSPLILPAIICSLILIIALEAFPYQGTVPRTPQLPLDRSCPHADIIEMAPGLPDNDPLQFLTVGADFPLHDIGDEIERDVPFDLCRPPGHQDRLFLCSCSRVRSGRQQGCLPRCFCVLHAGLCSEREKGEYLLSVLDEGALWGSFLSLVITR